MPTYEYACKQCGEHLEVVQKFTDDPLTTCPACTGPLRKVFGSIGISFKGSGFYKNDSRAPANGEKKKEPAAEGSSPGSTDTPSSPKGDAPAKADTAKTGDSGGGGGKAKKSDKGSSTAAAS